MFNIAKNVNDESANKLTAPKLIAYIQRQNGYKNMINSKPTKYSCFWICKQDAKSNAAQDDKQPNTTSHSDEEITKNKK